jgi:hypothetical protein
MQPTEPPAPQPYDGLPKYRSQYGEQFGDSHHGQNQMPRKTSVVATLALVFGVIGAIPVAVILGIIALARIPGTGQKGKGMAIGGMALAGLWAVFIALAVIGDPDPGRDASGQVTTQADVALAKLRVGDCVAEVD